MKTILHFLRSIFVFGMLVGLLTISLAIAPAQAVIRQSEEAPGQTVYQSKVYQSRRLLKDRQGGTWQAIAFQRTFPNHEASIYLRLIGFPGTANLDHSQPLTLTDSMGKTFTAADVSHDMFADQTQAEPASGQYDLQPILMQLELAIPLKLILPTLDQSEIVLNISPAVVEEWRSLMDQQ